MVIWQVCLCLFALVVFCITLKFSLDTSSYRQPIKLLLSLIVGLLCAGIAAQLWLSGSQKVISKPTVYLVEGSICSIPRIQNQPSLDPKPDSLLVRFDFCLSKIDGVKLNILQNNKLKLSYYRLEEQLAHSFRAGSKWRLNVKLKPNYGRLNPAGFDYEKWLLSEGYLATGYIKSASTLNTQPSVRELYHSVRQSIYDAVSLVTQNDKTRGVILALTMGERAEIEPNQWKYIVDSGTAHLLAISGLHIGIAALWAYYLFLFIFKHISWITKRYSAQRLSEFFSLASALLVTLLSGLGYPAQRALIMLSIFLICRWSGRKLSLAGLLGLSSITITVFQPFAVTSMSFWLSVYAVSVIALVVSYQQQTNGKLVKVKAWLRLNWLLFVGLIPISWWFFSQFSTVGFVANVLLIPLTTFVSAPLIYLGLISLVFSETLAAFLFYLVEHSISLTLWLQQELAGLNKLIYIPSLSITGGIALLLVVITLLLPKFVPGRSLVIPAFILLVVSFYVPNKRSNFKLVMFDVGHGLAINVSIGDKQLVYDTGFGRFRVNKAPSDQIFLNSPAIKQNKLNSEYSVAQTSLIPYLKHEGVKHIDKLVLSHNDIDHSGGFIDVIDNFSIGELLLGERDFIRSKRLEANLASSVIGTISTCHKRKSWSWQGVSFKFITTPNHFKVGENKTYGLGVKRVQNISSYSGNNASCILLIETKNNKILIAGDIEKRIERDLVFNDNSQTLVEMSILVAPHHGSETSSTVEFVNHLKPELVLFSAGYANQWKFPRRAVVERYRKVGANLLVSFETGAITVTESDAGRLEVTTERNRKQRFWH